MKNLIKAILEYFDLRKKPEVVEIPFPIVPFTDLRVKPTYNVDQPIVVNNKTLFTIVKVNEEPRTSYLVEEPSTLTRDWTYHVPSERYRDIIRAEIRCWHKYLVEWPNGRRAWLIEAEIEDQISYARMRTELETQQ